MDATGDRDGVAELRRTGQREAARLLTPCDAIGPAESLRPGIAEDP